MTSSGHLLTDEQTCTVVDYFQVGSLPKRGTSTYPLAQVPFPLQLSLDETSGYSEAL